MRPALRKRGLSSRRLLALRALPGIRKPATAPHTQHHLPSQSVIRTPIRDHTLAPHRTLWSYTLSFKTRLKARRMSVPDAAKPAPKAPKPETNSAPSDTGFRPPETVIAGIMLGFVGLGLVLLIAANWEVEWTWDCWEKASTIVRNFGLIVIAIPALLLAWSRTRTATRQADIANDQTRIAEKGLIIDRFQKGAQMLESYELSVRLAGIYALKELVKSDPKETYIIVLDLLFDFVRERSKARKPVFSPIPRKRQDPDYGPFPPDLQKALETASWLRNNARNAISMEKDDTWCADLSEANLSRARLVKGNLSSANLNGTNLYGAIFVNVNLSFATIWHSNLSQAHLPDANLSGAELWGGTLFNTDLFFADLSKTDLAEIKLNTKTKISNVFAYSDQPPKNMPDQIAKAITYRLPGEDMNVFQSRIALERKQRTEAEETTPSD
ncbi:pentapeptide repeat-containing protein [Roseibium algae]|uniref:Pentapeptide repeat-containing protein n=1 Tax=Roseibium algae TaxID=3123038 RepID=A0ABU8TJY3_9HYPH